MSERIATTTLPDGTRLTLARYQAFESQPAHHHKRPSASLVLAGSLHESAGVAEVHAQSLAGVYKPARLEHADRFGDTGALLLQIVPPRARTGDWAWAQSPSPVPWMALGLALLGRPGAVTIEDALQGALQSVRAAPPIPTPTPPWLLDVRQALSGPNAPRISALADRHGVHRVHLSRTFRRRFGLTPAEF
ncbi:MAG: helix-turn-helix transcriptional regulator, partial [Phycisphaerales bacterium]